MLRITEAQKRRIDRLLPGGIPRWVRVYDNGDTPAETIDRYTVVFSGRYTHKTGGEHVVLAMSGAPFHPQGFCQHAGYREVIDAPCGWPPAVGRRNHLGRRIRFEDLPKDCQRAVLQDYLELWDLEVNP